MNGTRRPHRIGRVWFAVSVFATLVAGCGGPPPTVATRRDAERSFETQLQAVRTGAASRIILDDPPTGLQWESLRGLTGLRELVLHRGVADDTKAEILATLPGIERLVLRESPLSDAGFHTIARLSMLRDLNVPKAGCTAEGVRALAAIPSLRSLRLGGANLAGRDVCDAVASLGFLRSLHLIDVRIGDDGLDALAGSPGLRNLYLDGAGVTNEAWERYFQRHPDVHVHVDQAHHDRDPARKDR